MSARESQLTGRLRLRHLFEVTEAAGERMDEMRPRFVRLADKTAAPRIVSAWNLFQTPAELAARVVALLPGKGRLLEPSAGLGRLFKAFRDVDADSPVVLVEVAAECAGELYRATEGDANATLVQGDFFEQSPERLGTFERIVMNPPFERGADIRHIFRAREFLAPGGTLVAICAGGPKQRAKLQPIAEQWIDLPAGSFRSEGTNVNAAIVVIKG